MPTAVSTRRLAAVAATLFVLILAFLAGRVHAGADPTQARTPTSSTVTPAPSSGDGGRGADGSTPPASPGFAPDQGATAPDQGGTVPDATGAVPDQCRRRR